MRFFNTAGPIRPDDHYYIPPLTWIWMGGVAEGLEQTAGYMDRCTAESVIW